MIKFIGAVMIVLSSTYIGFYKSYILKKRMISLRNIKSALTMLESEISFSQNILARVFVHISNLSDTNGLFLKASEEINEMGIKKAWENAVESTYKGMCLKNEDKEILYLFGKNLGMSDRLSQIKNINHTISMIDKVYVQAEEDYNKNSKLYRSAGILSGLFFAIILY